MQAKSRPSKITILYFYGLEWSIGAASEKQQYWE